MKTINNLSLIFVIALSVCGCNSGSSATANANSVNIQTISKSRVFLKQSYFNKPYGIAIDSTGNLYIAMADQNIIQKISATDHSISTIAGNGFEGKPVSGNLATSEPLSLVRKKYVSSAKGAMQSKSSSTATSFYGSVAIDGADNVYIADTNNNQIEKVDHTTGLMTVVAGGGSGSPLNGAQATSVTLSGPTGIAIDANNNLFIADNGNLEVEEVNLNRGVINIVAGGGNNTPGLTAESSTSVSIMPYGVATDNNRNIYITDTMNEYVEKINLSNKNLIVVAGNGTAGVPTPGASTNSALGSNITGITLDSAGNIYVADSSNNEIEKISSTNMLSVIVGNGQNGYPYSANPTTSSLSKPHSVAVDQKGNLFVADTDNQIIEKYSIDGDFYINYGTGFIRLVGAFQCVNDAVTSNKCGCLYDPQSGNTWYAGIKSGYLTNWLANGSDVIAFNGKNHCGLNNWHIPNLTTPAWGNTPYSLQPIVISAKKPGGSLSSLVVDAETKDDKSVFHLLNNGFYTDYGDLVPQLNGYWINASSGSYIYSNQSFGWMVLNYDNNNYSQMIAEPQMFIKNNISLAGKVLLISN